MDTWCVNLMLRNSMQLRSSATQEISPHFMQPESSLPHSQESATCPYPEPGRSSLFRPPFHLLKISFNIIIACAPAALFRFHHQDSVCTCPHSCYIPCPAYFSSFNYRNNIWWGVQSIKLFVTLYSSLPCYLVRYRSRYPPQHPILEYPQPVFFSQCERPSFTPM
jgi:hypothetical protein